MHATNPGRLCPHRFFLPLMRNERREIRAPAGTRPIATPANSPATGAMPPVGGIEGAGADGRLMEGTEGAEREGREREGAESFGAALAAVTAVCLREILAASRCALAFAFCSAAACSAAARATSFLLNGGGGGGGGSGGGGGGGRGAASFLPRAGRAFFSGAACDARKERVRTIGWLQGSAAGTRIQGLQAVHTFAGGGGSGAGFGGGGGFAIGVAARTVGAALPLVAERISARSFSWSAFAAASTSAASSAAFFPAFATTAGLRPVRADDCSDRTDGCSTNAEACRMHRARASDRLRIAPIDDRYPDGELKENQKKKCGPVKPLGSSYSGACEFPGGRPQDLLYIHTYNRLRLLLWF